MDCIAYWNGLAAVNVAVAATHASRLLGAVISFGVTLLGITELNDRVPYPLLDRLNLA
jgi:hypothetical protein